MTIRASHKEVRRDGKVVDETLTLTGNLGLYEIALEQVRERLGVHATTTIRYINAEARFLQIRSDDGETIYEWQGDRISVKLNQGDQEE